MPKIKKEDTYNVNNDLLLTIDYKCNNCGMEFTSCDNDLDMNEFYKCFNCHEQSSTIKINKL